MSFDLEHLEPAVLEFLANRHLASLTTLRPDGSPHVVPVGFSYDAPNHVVRIITQTTSRKAAHAANGGRASVMQFDGGRWLTLEGTISLVTDPSGIAAAIEGYTQRYQAPRSERSATRGAIEIAVDRIMGRV
jgi:F420H(2)-dependent biliverdin reductase